jgi:hypothetical protein
MRFASARKSNGQELYNFLGNIKEDRGIRSVVSDSNLAIVCVGCRQNRDFKNFLCVGADCPPEHHVILQAIGSQHETGVCPIAQNSGGHVLAAN